MPDMDGYVLMQQVRALPPEQNGLVLAEVLVQAITTLLRSDP